MSYSGYGTVVIKSNMWLNFGYSLHDLFASVLANLGSYYLSYFYFTHFFPLHAAVLK